MFNGAVVHIFWGSEYLGTTEAEKYVYRHTFLPKQVTGAQYFADRLHCETVRCPIFLDVTQCRSVVSYRYFGITYGTLGCPETSVNNYQSTQRRKPDITRYNKIYKTTHGGLRVAVSIILKWILWQPIHSQRSSHLNINWEERILNTWRKDRLLACRTFANR